MRGNRLCNLRIALSAAVLQALFSVAIEALADYNINYVIM